MKYFISILILFLSVLGYSQYQNEVFAGLKFSSGFYQMYNSIDYQQRPNAYPYYSGIPNSLNLGFYFNYNITDHIGVTFEPVYTNNKQKYKHSTTSISRPDGNDIYIYDGLTDINFNNFELPIGVFYFKKLSKFGNDLYLKGGLGFNYYYVNNYKLTSIIYEVEDFGSKILYDQIVNFIEVKNEKTYQEFFDDELGEFRINESETENPFSEHNFAITANLGLQKYFTYRFRVSLGIGVEFGVTPIDRFDETVNWPGILGFSQFFDRGKYYDRSYHLSISASYLINPQSY